MNIIIFGEFSGIIRDAFAKKGHNVISCDFLDSEKPGWHYKGNGYDIIDFPFDLGIFHPFCTNTAVSGARHFKKKKQNGEYFRGVSNFMYMWKRAMHIPLVCFEHPVSIISTYFRKPDQIIQPYEFEEEETKAICLYLRGLPLLKSTKIMAKREPRVWKEAPSKDRWKNRSRSYLGIAKAMAEQWGNLTPELSLEVSKTSDEKIEVLNL